MKFMVNARRRWSFAAAVLAMMLVASCGGGTQVQPFVPARVLAFGDETSFIDADGRKYSVNALTTVAPVGLDCKADPLWMQYVASRYALVFPQCNPDKVVAPASRIFAVPNAKVAELTAQVDQQVAAGGFTGVDLVTVLIGANDIVAQYARYPGVGRDQLATELEQAGNAVAAQVNRIADLGGKVLLSTVPDMGLTPFALAENSANPDRAALLSFLTLRFNSAMRASIVNDGRKIGLVLTDERVQLIGKVPSGFGFVNARNAACAVALPDCTTATLAADPASTTGGLASATTWLWADATHLSAGGHTNIGILAAQRASGNPF